LQVPSTGIRDSVLLVREPHTEQDHHVVMQPVGADM